MTVSGPHREDFKAYGTQDLPPPPFAEQSQSQSHSQPKETFTLLLFASAQSYCDNKESLTFSAPTTFRDLFDELERRYPGIGEKVLKSSQFSVNLEYVDCTWEGTMQGKDKEVTLNARDEVGIIPPVSSG